MLRQHVESFGQAYAEVFDEGEMRSHAAAFASPSSPHLPGLFLRPTVSGSVICTVVANEYPAIFSLLAGVLGAHGMSIRSGDAFTAAGVATRSSRPFRRRDLKPVPRRIIDRFEGRPPANRNFTDWCRSLGDELDHLFRLLHSNTPQKLLEARQLVHERVAGRISESVQPSADRLYPVEIDLDTRATCTRLVVRGQDTPFFLYSLGTALAVAGVSVERVRIATHGDQIEDELEILDTHGRKIESRDRLDLLRFSVLLTKQFTFFLGAAPDPYAAIQRFELLAEDVFSSPDRSRWTGMLNDTRSLSHLARVLGASDYLWEDFIRNQYEELLPLLGQGGLQQLPPLDRSAMIERLDHALMGDAPVREALNRWKDQEAFHIDVRHILTPGATVRDLAEPLCQVAELVLDRALASAYADLAVRHGTPRTVGGLAVPYALFGLGKFGGVAMGYASDIEILLVYSDNGSTDGGEPLANSEFFDRLVRDATALVVSRRQGVFEIDLRLRPYGKSGPLACSLDNFCRYYGPDGPALDYERLALTRLRAVAGDIGLGQRLERLRDAFVYEAQSISRSAIVELRRKQLETKGADRRPNAKFSAGALVDLEYCVQLLQITHAGTHPELRTPRIHEALEALSTIGVLTPEDSGRLTHAYYFMRELINALRMLRGNAKDLFLPDAGGLEYRHLARRMGMGRRGDLDAGHRLLLEFETQTAVIRDFYERHLGHDAPANPALGSIVDLILGEHPHPDLVARICGQIGVDDAGRAILNLHSLAGDGERRERFCRLAILAGDILRSAAADQDMALNNWERFCAAIPDPAAHFDRLLLQPSRLDILLRLFGGSQFLADTLRRNPEFFDWATDPAILAAAHGRQRVLQDIREFCGEPCQDSAWLDALRRFRRRAILRIAARDLCLAAPLEEITAELSALAEGIVETALHAADGFLRPRTSPPPPLLDCFCIYAFGKLGGDELNYSSDIDLLGVFAPPPDDSGEGARYFAKLLERTRDNLTTHTAEGYAYRVDFRLRPYGRSGPLVVSTKSVARYYQREAALWELQAQLKLRPIAGNLVLGYGVLTTIRQATVAHDIPPAEVARSIRRLRDMASQRRETTETADVKDGPGGIRDIEFLVQGLQLSNLRLASDLGDANTLRALLILRSHHLLPRDETDTLREGYRFLRRLEHMLQLREDRQIHVMPTDDRERTILARTMLGPDADSAQLLRRLGEVRTHVRDIYDRRLPS